MIRPPDFTYDDVEQRHKLLVSATRRGARRMGVRGSVADHAHALHWLLTMSRGSVAFTSVIVR